MNKRIIIFILLGLLLVVIGYRFLTREPDPVQVLVQAAQAGAIEATVSNTRAGTIKARHRAKLAPAIGGQIESLHVRKADSVKAGQVLLTIWNKDIEADLKLARAQVNVAKSTSHERCLMAAYSKRQAQRLTELRAKKTTSESAYDQALSNAEAQAAACSAAKDQILVSMARVASAEALLERTILKAPFDGMVAEVNGEVGEYITPSPPGIATLPAIDLVNTEKLYVAAPIDEIDAAQIQPGLATRIHIDAYPDTVFPGTVRSIAPYVLELAKQARTVDVEVDFAGQAKEKNLLVGYSADVEIVVDSREQVIRIPTEAVIQSQYVYILDRESGTLRKQEVATGLANWKETEIRSGVSAGELVVTSVDREGLADGVRAEIEESD
ncbi:efflux RND transporter periplasmic adaptor subunit [Desulfogranum japonicum]|uniref:efflux RND transporter periplasmic adaptor subunit n=1 Tax=Desulfogranum japonicum TaxID=231447 RepID=UPI0003F8714D|nr:efflux RND transporter periplasmic adaptor subunit [Desulfogranum japonicum]